MSVAQDLQPRPLSPRETDVYKALMPYLKAGSRFDPRAVGRGMNMTRPLLNLYLTRLTRAQAIVRIGRGVYVLFGDARAKGAPIAVSPNPVPAPKVPVVPRLLPGVTMAMLMGGRSRGRRSP